MMYAKQKTIQLLLVIGLKMFIYPIPVKHIAIIFVSLNNQKMQKFLDQNKI